MRKRSRQFVLWFAFISLLLLGFQFRGPDISNSTAGVTPEVGAETTPEDTANYGLNYGELAWKAYSKKIFQTCPGPSLPDPAVPDLVEQAVPMSNVPGMMSWIRWAVMGALSRYIVSEATVPLVRPLLRFVVSTGTRVLIGFLIRAIGKLRRLRAAFDLDIV